MQSGPVRFRVNAKTMAAEAGLSHRVKLRSTEFRLSPVLEGVGRPPIADIYAALAADEPRNDLIFDDVLKALDAKRTPLLLTERRRGWRGWQCRFSKASRPLEKRVVKRTF